jgi:Flp pilus assembly protein TadG
MLRRDDGVAAILICLFVVFLVLPVAAVSVDLSSAYANRRQMQNAADAAAQAGAQTMAAVRQGTAAASSLDSTALNVAAQNGSDTSGTGYSCNVATVSYNPVSVTQGPSCASWTGDTAYNAVTVHTHHEVDTFFARAISGAGATSTTADATATATLQKVIPPSDFGNAVFAMCASASAGNGNGNGIDPAWIPLLVTVNGQFVLNVGQVAGTATAVGHRYVVWSNAGGNSNLSRCGLQSASFDGLICGLAAPPCGQPITLPNDLAVSTGAKVGPTLATMAGYPGCDGNTLANLSGPTTFSPCAMVIPVCDSSNGATGTNGTLHCDAWGEFLLSPGSQDKTDSSCTFVIGSSGSICGELLGDPNVLDGTPTADPPGAGDPVRIALVQ